MFSSSPVYTYYPVFIRCSNEGSIIPVVDLSPAVYNRVFLISSLTFAVSSNLLIFYTGS